jgi:hypothetical protein
MTSCGTSRFNYYHCIDEFEENNDKSVDFLWPKKKIGGFKSVIVCFEVEFLS